MCTVSMIMDHYREKWEPYLPYQPNPWVPNPPVPTHEEVEEFRRLLDRARDYDRRHNEPNCELAEKRRVLKEIADQLGIDISFVDASSGVT